METTRQQIERFVRENFNYFSGLGGAVCAEQAELDPECDDFDGLELTIATDDGWNEWGFQTGDNSYSGACYFFPHWAVVHFYGDDDANDLVNDVLGQLDDLTADVSPTIPGFSAAL